VNQRLPLSLVLALAVGCGGTPAGPQAPLVEEGTLEPAVEALLGERRRAVQEAPNSPVAWGELGIAFDVHAMLAEAVACYREAARLAPEEFRWAYFLGLGLRIGDQAAALEQLARAVGLREGHAPLHHHLGHGALQLERFESAEASFQRAVNLDPSLVAAHLGLAKVALGRDDPALAQEHLARALEGTVRTDEVHWLAAEAARRLGDEQAAADHAERAGSTPGHEPLPDAERDGLGWVHGRSLRWRRAKSDGHLRRGDPKGALAVWTEALATEPESARLWEAQAICQQAAGLLDGALESYREAIELDPEAPRMHLALGNLLGQNGDAQGGVEAIERALALDPDLHVAGNMLGVMLLELGQSQRGLELLESTSQALPDSPDASFNLAMGYKGLDRLAEAEATFGELLERWPDFSRARYERGVLRGSDGRLEEALEDFERVVADAPQLSSAYTSLARAQADLGRYAASAATLRKGATHIRMDPFTRGQLAWLLATCPEEEVRDGEEALKISRWLCDGTRYKDPNALQILAGALAEVGEFEEAIEMAEKAVAEARKMEGNPLLVGFVEKVQAHLARYRAGQAVRSDS
jgi:tetratricopeptide (TPR) repeat protein